MLDYDKISRSTTVGLNYTPVIKTSALVPKPQLPNPNTTVQSRPSKPSPPKGAHRPKRYRLGSHTGIHIRPNDPNDLDGEWTHPPTATVLEVAGLWPMLAYIRRRRETVLRFASERYIYRKCLVALKPPDEYDYPNLIAMTSRGPVKRAAWKRRSDSKILSVPIQRFHTDI
jgi:hypothetical protein